MNIFKKIFGGSEKTPEDIRTKLEKEAIKKYFDKDNEHIYYVAQRNVKMAINEEHDNGTATQRAIRNLKDADRLQKAYEDGMNDIRKQFLGLPTTRWYIDYDLDYPNKN